MALDGDAVGRKIEHLILLEDLEGLAGYGKSIAQTIGLITSLAIELGGMVYLEGGDNVLIEVESLDTFLQRFAELQPQFTCSFGMGIGRTVLDAYLALKFAKSTGPGTTIFRDSERNCFTYPNQPQTTVICEL